jgi:hypothetical protein
VENGNQSHRTSGIEENLDIYVSSVSSFVLSLYRIKARNCSLLDQLRYFLASTTKKPDSHLTPTENVFKTACPQNKVPNQYLMSVTSQLWTLILRYLMVYVRWSAWTNDIFQRLSSSWSPRSSSHAPTSGIYRGPCLSHSLICINLRDWWVFVIHAISCTVQIITAKNHILVSCLVCLTTLTAPSFVHTMETVRIFQRLSLTTMIVMMIIFIEFAVAISMNSWIDFFLWRCLECVYLFMFTIFLTLNQQSPYHSTIRREIWCLFCIRWIVNYIQIRVNCFFLVHGAHVRIIEQFTFYYSVRLFMNNTWYN